MDSWWNIKPFRIAKRCSMILTDALSSSLLNKAMLLRCNSCQLFPFFSLDFLAWIEPFLQMSCMQDSLGTPSEQHFPLNEVWKEEHYTLYHSSHETHLLLLFLFHEFSLHTPLSFTWYLGNITSYKHNRGLLVVIKGSSATKSVFVTKTKIYFISCIRIHLNVFHSCNFGCLSNSWTPEKTGYFSMYDPENCPYRRHWPFPTNQILTTNISICHR